jgi:glycosyltransferase involved in cell wall biosynthesis
VSVKISIVVPLYNEGASFAFLINRLNDLMSPNPLTIEVVLIDDGSTDNTAQLINQVALSDDRYTGLFLARNYGHQIALSAGISIARGSEAIMIIDGDLQDPPELLPTFYKYLSEGYDVVYGVRKKRKENIFKRFSYYLFYRIQEKIVSIDMPLDSGDFSLISRRVINILNKMPEESRFIRGMRTWVGYKQIGVEYERDKRVAGSSKYSIKMLVRLAYNGVFNFSDFPIKVITSLGFFAIILSLAFLFTVLIKRIFYNSVPEGYTSLFAFITLFSGVQLISLGIIGEYIYRIFFQVKGRPLYNVKHKIIEKEVINE